MLLFAAKTCPFAHRTEVVRELSQANINTIYVDPVLGNNGWVFTEPYNGMNALSEVYKSYQPDRERGYSVPLLIHDNKVMDGSIDICKLLLPFLFEQDTVAFIDDFNVRFSKAHYVAGHTFDLQTFKDNYNMVFGFLDDLDQKLTGTYILGEQISICDVLFFTHIARFDAIYHDLFHLDGKYIKDYPNISRWLDNLLAQPAFGGTLDIQVAKRGYEQCIYHAPSKLTPFSCKDIN